MSSNYKPCPFCGGDSKLKRVAGDFTVGVGYAVYCTKCLAMTNGYDLRFSAVIAWNRRDGMKTHSEEEKL